MNASAYINFENLLTHSDVEAYKNTLSPHLVKTGRNSFEGHKTNGVYTPLAKSPLFVDTVMLTMCTQNAHSARHLAKYRPPKRIKIHDQLF